MCGIHAFDYALCWSVTCVCVCVCVYACVCAYVYVRAHNKLMCVRQVSGGVLDNVLKRQAGDDSFQKVIHKIT
jgi:hypothetical protein